MSKSNKNITIFRLSKNKYFSGQNYTVKLLSKTTVSLLLVVIRFMENIHTCILKYEE